MEVKKILGLLLTLLGVAGLIVGLLRVFGGETLDGNSWFNHAVVTKCKICQRTDFC